MRASQHSMSPVRIQVPDGTLACQMFSVDWRMQ